MVFNAVAKNDARKVRKMTGDSAPWNIRIARGTQARIGTGRRVSEPGKTYSRNVRAHPRKSPRGTPSPVARRKAMATRRTLTQMCWYYSGVYTESPYTAARL